MKLIKSIPKIMRFFIVIIFFAISGIMIFMNLFVSYATSQVGILNIRLTFTSPVLTNERKIVNIQEQLPPYPLNITPTVGDWQLVNDTKFKFYVFSAFLESRLEQRAVRIIGITKTKQPEKVWCRLWYNSIHLYSITHTSKTIPAKVKVIREHHGSEYSACFVLCPLESNQIAPATVSVVANVLSAPANLLIVNDNYNETIPHNKYGVCVKPMYNCNETMRLLEFLEFNRVLGAPHVTFYNLTIGPQVDCILKDYVARGLVTVLPWRLDMPSRKEIWTKGIFASLNDCLYRSMYRYSHILLIDLDEFIIPRYNHTLPQFIDYLAKTVKKKGKEIGSYLFRNAFFYLQWYDDAWVYNSNDLVATNLYTLRKTRRRTLFHAPFFRSKYICRPEVTVEVGNHFVWQFLPGYGTYIVPVKAGITQHYRRECEGGRENCLETQSTIDTTALRYSDSLVSAVKSEFLHLKDKCGLETLKHSSKPKKSEYVLVYQK